jgi:hypothetical protein
MQACTRTLVQLTQPTAGVLLTAPADGVITSWHVHGNTANGVSGSLALRVLRRDPDGIRFAGVTTSAGVTAVFNDGSPAHAVSIPVRGGDYVGVDVSQAATSVVGAPVWVYTTQPSGATYDAWDSGLPNGSTLTPSRTPGGRLMLNAVESLRPAVSGVSPSSGSTAGGEAVTITGSDLDGATGVSFGGTPASSFTVVSPTQVTATAPARPAGTVDVQVTTPGGVSPATGADVYSYVGPSGGGGPGPGGTSGGVALAAVGTERLSPSAFPAAPSGPSALTAKRSYGTKVRYTLNEAARVRFTVQQAQPGRKTGTGTKTRCVPQTNKNRKAKKCTRLVNLLGTFTLNGRAGANSFRFSGRIGGKRLKPGSYRLVATPTANGRTGKRVSATFRIIK